MTFLMLSDLSISWGITTYTQNTFVTIIDEITHGVFLLTGSVYSKHLNQVRFVQHRFHKNVKTKKRDKLLTVDSLTSPSWTWRRLTGEDVGELLPPVSESCAPLSLLLRSISCTAWLLNKSIDVNDQYHFSTH